MTGVIPPMQTKKKNPYRLVTLDNQFRRWLPKSTREGLPTPAVERRFKVVGNIDLSKEKDRKKFGYAYLEFV